MPGPAVATTLNALSLTTEAVDLDDELSEALLERLTELDTWELSLTECVQVMAALARPTLQLDGDSESVMAEAIVEALVNIQAIGWHCRPRGIDALRLLSESWSAAAACLDCCRARETPYPSRVRFRTVTR
jgi:hypothetical protein